MLYLTEIHKTVGAAKVGNRSWRLLGEIVADKCLAALIGIRSQRLRTAGAGRLDLRYGCFGSVTWIIQAKFSLVSCSH